MIPVSDPMKDILRALLRPSSPHRRSPEIPQVRLWSAGRCGAGCAKGGKAPELHSWSSTLGALSIQLIQASWGLYEFMRVCSEAACTWGVMSQS